MASTPRATRRPNAATLLASTPRATRRPNAAVLLAAACVLCAALLSAAPKPAQADSVNVANWSQLEAALNQEGATEVILGAGPFSATITATNSITVNTGQDVTLTLAMGTLTLGDYTITVQKGATLTVQPSTDRVGTVNGQNLFIVEEGAKLVVNGGIYRANATAIQNNGELMMIGGSINLFPRPQTAATLTCGPASTTTITGGTLNGYSQTAPAIAGAGAVNLTHGTLQNPYGPVLTMTGGTCALNIPVNGAISATNATLNLTAPINGRIEANGATVDAAASTQNTQFAVANGARIQAHNQPALYEVSGTPSTLVDTGGAIIFKGESMPHFVNSMQNDWVFNVAAGITLNSVNYSTLAGHGTCGSLTLSGEGSVYTVNWATPTGTLKVCGPTISYLTASCPLTMESGTVQNLMLDQRSPLTGQYYDATIESGLVNHITMGEGTLTLGNDLTGPTLPNGVQNSPEWVQRLIVYKAATPQDRPIENYDHTGSTWSTAVTVRVELNFEVALTQWIGNVLPDAYAFSQYAQRASLTRVNLPGEITVPAGLRVANNSGGVVIAHYPDGVATLAPRDIASGPTQGQAPMSGSKTLTQTVAAASANIGVANTASYTADSWSEYMSAFATASQTLNNADATEAESRASALALTGAIHRLVPLSVGGGAAGDLAYLVSVTQGLEASHWSAESWATLQTRLAAAVSLLNAGLASESELSTAATALNQALNNLTPAGGGVAQTASTGFVSDGETGLNSVGTDLSHTSNGLLSGGGDAAAVESYRALLQQTYDTAVSIMGPDNPTYTFVSWTTYASALENAEGALENPASTAAELAECTLTLNDAVLNLTVMPDPTAEYNELAFWVDFADMFPENEYTAESWSVLQSALRAAQTLLNDEKPDYDMLVYANNDVTEALAGLVPLTKPVYRLYNPWSKQHLYTTDANEYATLERDGWNGEGVAWYEPESGVGTYPVARLYNPFNGSPYYLKADDAGQMDELLGLGWVKDGQEVWFESADPVTGYEIYTLFNPYSTVDTHLWTTDYDEYRALIARGWEPNTPAIWARNLP